MRLKRLPWRLLTGAVFSVLVLCGFSSLQMEDIETALMEEDYARAQELSRNFIEALPSRIQLNKAQYYLGLSQLYLNDYRSARDNFQQVMRNQPDPLLRDRALIGEIDSYHLEGKYEVALHKAEHLLRQNPDPSLLGLVYLKIARSDLKLSRWDDARRYLEKIIAHYPGSMEAHTAGQLLEEKQFFSVQVGSFLERTRAEKLVMELEKRGEYAYIVETMASDQMYYYRVRVGQLSTLSEAKALKQKLLIWGYPTLIYP